jgi:hypothetical protein
MTASRNLFRLACLLGLIFCTVLISMDAFAGELLVVAIRPRTQVDLSSPRQLAQTLFRMLRSQATYPIGHMNIRLQCNDTKAAQWSGFNIKNTHSVVKDVVQTGSGLGVFFRRYQGFVESDSLIRRGKINKVKKSSLLAAMSFSLTDSQCETAQKWLADFRQSPMSKVYSFSASPQNNEGAICATYVLALIETLQLDPEGVLREQWTHNLRVPHTLIGRPFRTEFVGLEEIFHPWNTHANRWAHEEQDHEPLSLVDPYLAWKYIRSKASKNNLMTRVDPKNDFAPWTWLVQNSSDLRLEN